MDSVDIPFLHEPSVRNISYHKLDCGFSFPPLTTINFHFSTHTHTHTHTQCWVRHWCSKIWTTTHHGSLVAQMVKCLPTMQETRVRSLDGEDPLEKEMATHSSTLAWKIPREEPGRLQSMGSQRVRHDRATLLHYFTSRPLNTSQLHHLKLNRKNHDLFQQRKKD